MVAPGLYRDLLIAISGGVVGAISTFLGQIVVQRYRVYLDKVPQLRNEVYIPLFNEVSSIESGGFPSPPRSKWQRVSPHLKLKIDEGLREELDDYEQKFERLLRVQNKLVANRGVFDETMPEDLKTISDAQITIRAEGDFELPDHSINTTTLLNNYEDALFSAENPEELRKN